MKAQNQNWNVPLLAISKPVYFKVDNLCLYVLLILLTFTNQSDAQNTRYVDSILSTIKTQDDKLKVSSYRRLFVHYFQIDMTAAKPYLDSSIAISERIKDNSLIASTNSDYGVYLQITSNPEASLPIFDKAIQLFKDLGDKEQQSTTINNKAVALNKLGRLEAALEANLESLQLKEELKAEDDLSNNDYWDESMAASYWNIGNLLGDLENFEKSNTYYRKAEEVYEKLHLIDDLESIRANLAINLKATKNYDEAIPLFKKAIAYNISQNYHNDLAGTYDNLGQIYLETDSLDKAKSYFDKALAISKEYKEETLVALNLRHIGEVLLKLQNYNEALPYFKQAIIISKENNANKQLIKDYLDISKAYAGLNNYKAAYEYYTNHTVLYKTVYGEENIKRVNELEIQYQSAKKEKEIIQQKNDIERLEQNEKIASARQMIMGIALLSIVLFGATLFYGVRQKMKRNALKREKLDANLQFKEKELTTHALHLAHKNEVLLDLKAQMKQLKSEGSNPRHYQKIINHINLDINNDTNWEQFRNYFEDVHKDFNANIKKNYPEVSSNDLRLMSLLKMNLSSKEIANILNISPEGVKKARYRLRKKLNLTTEDSLQELVIRL